MKPDTEGAGLAMNSWVVWRETLSQGRAWVWEIEHRANVADVAASACWPALLWKIQHKGEKQND